MTEVSDSNGLLLDLATALGRIEGQNQLILQEQGRASDSRKNQYEATDRLRAEVADLASTTKQVKASVAEMKPDVDKMKGFRSQVALSVVFVTAAVTGSINLIWIALSHMGEIKTALRDFLR